MWNRSLCAALLAGALALPAAQAAEISGHHVADTQTVNSQALQLNGGGVRTKFIFDVYLAVLYTTAKTSDANAVIQANTPRRIELQMLREVSAAKMHESFVEGMNDNTPDAQKKFASQLDALDKLFKEVASVAKGDVIALDFLPGQGTRVTVRGKAYPLIVGDDFASALLAIWLGKNPVQSGLKTALLGGH